MLPYKKMDEVLPNYATCVLLKIAEDENGKSTVHSRAHALIIVEVLGTCEWDAVNKTIILDIERNPMDKYIVLYTGLLRKKGLI
mmetsp:Transcript_14895/g.18115  ORF Transcript_14895/g.18115 Transcript_14895/m.18115 type:complete len:84 (+) Transcript_14895:2132-2383(+)